MDLLTSVTLENVLKHVVTKKPFTIIQNIVDHTFKSLGLGLKMHYVTFNY